MKIVPNFRVSILGFTPNSRSVFCESCPLVKGQLRPDMCLSPNRGARNGEKNDASTAGTSRAIRNAGMGERNSRGGAQGRVPLPALRQHETRSEEHTSELQSPMYLV